MRATLTPLRTDAVLVPRDRLTARLRELAGPMGVLNLTGALQGRLEPAARIVGVLA